MLLFSRLAVPLGLIDHPDQVRKRHLGAIPLVGGPAIMLALIVGILIDTGGMLHPWTALACTALAATLIGVFDDCHDVSALGRLLGQILLAGAAVTIGGVSITHLGDLSGIGNDLELGMIGPFIALGALAAAMNAYNMLDGTDGQCAMLALIPCLALLYTATAAGQTPPVILVILIGALPVYLLFNLQPHQGAWLPKCFLGDSGATLLGLLVGWMLIVSAQAPLGWLEPVTVLWLAALPLFDTLFVMGYRLRKRRSLMTADRNHIHHLLADHGFGPLRSLLFVSVVATLMALAGLGLEAIAAPAYLSFGLLVLLFVGYVWSARHLHQLRESGKIGPNPPGLAR